MTLLFLLFLVVASRSPVPPPSAAVTSDDVVASPRRGEDSAEPTPHRKPVKLVIDQLMPINIKPRVSLKTINYTR